MANNKINWRLAAAVLSVISSTAVGDALSVSESTSDPVIVEGVRTSDDKPWEYNRKTRFEHSLPEVDANRITVTRRTSVEDLSLSPPVIDNSWRELFDRLPSLNLAEQQNPTELNVSYRGIGNPQESEYVLMLEDGLPMEMDFIGFPTIYYQPFSQTVSRIEMIRGGSGLLYGPEAAPVLNFVSQFSKPQPSELSSEQVLGNQGLYSGFINGIINNSLGEFDLNAGHRQASGFRDNGDYQVDTANVQWRQAINDRTQIKFIGHLYRTDSGLAGLMSYSQFVANSNQSTTPNDHLWMERDQWIVQIDSQLNDRLHLEQKIYQQYSNLITRSLSYTNFQPAPQSASLNIQQFNGEGLDGRAVWRYGHGDALSIGYSYFHSTSPYQINAKSNDSVTPSSYGQSGVTTYQDHRKTDYEAIFAENVFRFKRFHALVSARIDHEQVSADQTVATHPTLGEVSRQSTIPLFGLGLGNDFGKGNETYLNISQGFRPIRYLDISSPTSNLSPQNHPEPTHYLNTELGVHGWPKDGLYYDVGLFDVKANNRIESQHLTQTQVIDVNTGNTESYGFESESSVNLSRLFSQSLNALPVEWSQALTLLNARFTESSIAGQIGKTPAYAPKVLLKSSLTVGDPHRLSAKLGFTHLGAQFFQDSNVVAGSTPAKIPAYTVLDLTASGSLNAHWHWELGVTNLSDQVYYSRVFLFGGNLEPAPRRSMYFGIRYLSQ